jgi:hypothetical protein
MPAQRNSRGSGVDEELMQPGEVKELGTERRSGADRRKLTLMTFIRGSLTPRRRENRRGPDDEGLLDWHEPHLLFLAVLILLLSITDAFLTLKLIGNGAVEVNPVMAYMLEQAPRLFALTKMALTGLGLVVLVALARARVFRIIRISNFIHWALLGYLALIGYEAWLLRKVL